MKSQQYDVARRGANKSREHEQYNYLWMRKDFFDRDSMRSCYCLSVFRTYLLPVKHFWLSVWVNYTRCSLQIHGSCFCIVWLFSGWGFEAPQVFTGKTAHSHSHSYIFIVSNPTLATSINQSHTPWSGAFWHKYMQSWWLKWSAACVCWAVSQTVDHILFDCEIFRPPKTAQNLRVMDVEMKNWLQHLADYIWWAYTHTQEEEIHRDVANLYLNR